MLKEKNQKKIKQMSVTCLRQADSSWAWEKQKLHGGRGEILEHGKVT